MLLVSPPGACPGPQTPSPSRTPARPSAPAAWSGSLPRNLGSSTFDAWKKVKLVAAVVMRHIWRCKKGRRSWSGRAVMRWVWTRPGRSHCCFASTPTATATMATIGQPRVITASTATTTFYLYLASKESALFCFPCYPDFSYLLISSQAPTHS